MKGRLEQNYGLDTTIRSQLEKEGDYEEVYMGGASYPRPTSHASAKETYFKKLKKIIVYI